MDARALEAAWDTFVANDVAIRANLALDYAEIDNDAFRALQQESLSGSPEQKHRAADGLAKIADEIGSTKVWDQVVASAFDRVDRYADALEARRRGLLLAATWHPQDCARVVGNIAWNLQNLGDRALAETWSTRALFWDHENPYVLGSLAELWLERGGVEPALALRAHMTAFGVPASHFEDLDRMLTERGVSPATPVAPRNPFAPESLGRLDLRGWLTFAAGSAADTQMTPHDRLHNLAIASLMARDVPAALAQARAAAAIPVDDTVGTAWTRAVLASVERLAGGSRPREGVDDPSPEARAGALDHAVQTKDAATLMALTKDPELQIALFATQALGLELGKLDLPQVLGPVAAFEASKGLDVHPGSASHAVRRAKRRTLGPRQPIQVPEEGLGHPLFETLAPGETLAVFVVFDDVPDPSTSGQLQQAMVGFEKTHDKKSLEAGFQGAPGAVAALFTNPKKLFGKKPVDPRPAAKAFVDAVAGTGIPLGTILYERVVPPTRKGSSLFRAVDDPRLKSSYDLHDAEALQAALDPSAVQPHPEPEEGLFMMLPSGGQYLPEWRSTPPFLAGGRVCYGLLDKLDDRPRDPRTDAFRDALRRSFDRWFRKEPPPFRNKKGVDFEVDPIAWQHKRGYRVFLEGVCPELLMNLPGTFRYREYEMFVAFRDACRETGVVPVMQWMRDGGVWIFNVWEP